MKKIIATIVALVFSTSAYAVTISDISVGASYNYGVYAADGKEENFTHTGTLEKTTRVTGKAFVDDYATVFVEMAFNENISLGVSYAPESIDTPQNINSGEGGDGKTDIKVEASFEDLTTVYLLAKSDIGVFAKAGYSQMDINITSQNAGTYKDTETDGVEFALGYERDLGGISARAELAYHSFDDVKANNGITDKNEITVSNMEGATARISLVKSF
tara:strand:- start:1369 stop:2019 length:651 start_codon:yes stop_codon:yes gene_type:complete